MRRLLVVDDEPDILAALQELVQGEFPDVEVTACLGGFAALDQLSKASFDGVLSDFRMPEMDGADLLIAVRQRWPGVRTCLFSAHTDPATVATIRQRLPGIDIIPKAEDVEVLVERISRLLG